MNLFAAIFVFAAFADRSFCVSSDFVKAVHPVARVGATNSSTVDSDEVEQGRASKHYALDFYREEETGERHHLIDYETVYLAEDASSVLLRCVVLDRPYNSDLGGTFYTYSDQKGEVDAVLTIDVDSVLFKVKYTDPKLVDLVKAHCVLRESMPGKTLNSSRVYVNRVYKPVPNDKSAGSSLQQMSFVVVALIPAVVASLNLWLQTKQLQACTPI